MAEKLLLESSKLQGKLTLKMVLGEEWTECVLLLFCMIVLCLQEGEKEEIHTELTMNEFRWNCCPLYLSWQFLKKSFVSIFFTEK